MIYDIGFLPTTKDSYYHGKIKDVDFRIVIKSKSDVRLAIKLSNFISFYLYPRCRPISYDT